MSSRFYPSSPLIGACVAVWRGDKVLLGLRSNAPNADTWAMPGGMVEVGETLEQAAKREILEETNLTLPKVTFNRFHEIIRDDDAGKTKTHYVLAMFAAISEEGEAVAGDDAKDVAWFTLDELKSVPTTAYTLEFVRESQRILF